MADFAMNQVTFGYDGEEDAFPHINPGITVPSSRFLVQFRRSKRKTKSGIILTEDVRDTEIWNNQVAKVLQIGPVAFRDRKTLEPWPEGLWVDVGDYVRVPKHGGDRWNINGDDGEQVMLGIYADHDLLGKINSFEDAMAMKAFL